MHGMNKYVFDKYERKITVASLSPGLGKSIWHHVQDKGYPRVEVPKPLEDPPDDTKVV